jgi:hypothetical protein
MGEITHTYFAPLVRLPDAPCTAISYRSHHERNGDLMNAVTNQTGVSNAPTPLIAQRGRFFFFGMACLIAAIVFVGFAPTFYLQRVYHSPSLATLFEVHGAVFTAWIVLLIAQTLLIQAERADVHRRLGIAGTTLAAAMVVIGVMVAIQGAVDGTAGTRVGVPPLTFLTIPLGAIVIFGVLVTIAIFLRRNHEAHKRLILIATINITAPAIGRIGDNVFHIATPLFIVGSTAALVVACILFDWITRRKVHFVFAVVGPMTMISGPLRLAFGYTDAWLGFAKWLTS